MSNTISIFPFFHFFANGNFMNDLRFVNTPFLPPLSPSVTYIVKIINIIKSKT